MDRLHQRKIFAGTEDRFNADGLADANRLLQFCKHLVGGLEEQPGLRLDRRIAKALIARHAKFRQRAIIGVEKRDARKKVANGLLLDAGGFPRAVGPRNDP